MRKISPILIIVCVIILILLFAIVFYFCKNVMEGIMESEDGSKEMIEGTDNQTEGFDLEGNSFLSINFFISSTNSLAFL